MCINFYDLLNINNFKSALIFCLIFNRRSRPWADSSVEEVGAEAAGALEGLLVFPVVDAGFVA